ncbi:unnamed protein product [Caenorhabditis angaria]|uniref:Tail-anchored protein insertion receptor WRB n=1 Tax=Caenorhabditis angaria TaxID=860376 RepID=A0A9P1I450_9PELO|nr:unnamed protein product [Caenorhabditis angaria]
MRNLLVFAIFCIIIENIFGCAPDVKFKEDHHRRKELDEKFVHNLVELKNHEEILLKAVEALKVARTQKDDVEIEIDYKTRIAEIEKELRNTKEDHAKLLEKHDQYVRGYDKPKTWWDTIGKWTGDAFGRLIYQTLCALLVLLVPLILRPFQRRWLESVRNGGPIIQEVSDDGLTENPRISSQELRQLLEDPKTK